MLKEFKLNRKLN